MFSTFGGWDMIIVLSPLQRRRRSTRTRRYIPFEITYQSNLLFGKTQELQRLVVTPSTPLTFCHIGDFGAWLLSEDLQSGKNAGSTLRKATAACGSYLVSPTL